MIQTQPSRGKEADLSPSKATSDPDLCTNWLVKDKNKVSDTRLVRSFDSCPLQMTAKNPIRDTGMYFDCQALTPNKKTMRWLVNRSKHIYWRGRK